MKDTLNMKFITLCSLLTIPLFAQAEKCEDAFPASQTSAVSYNARDIASRNRNWMHFEDARTFIQNQGIQTSTEFKQWSRSGQRPENFPSMPNRIYKDQWTGWGYFLGTDNIANRNKEWMNFEDAKTFIQNQGIQTLIEFQKWSKSGRRPENFPSNPYRVYKDQWTDWGDFLGTGTIAHKNKEWMSYQEAKTFIQNLIITSKKQFQKWSKSGQRPENFPSNPYETYKDQWIGWGDFLSTGTITHKNKEWMSFEDAKTFIQNQGIQTSTEFKQWSRSGQRPKNFPSSPNIFYKDQWTSWGDFLSTGAIAHKNKKWMSFEDAKAFIQNQGIRTSAEFQKWSSSDQRPQNFPSTPNIFYKDQWTGWSDFLGTETIARRNKEWMSYQEAKTFIQTQGIRTSAEFQKWSASDQRPENFPSNPYRVYKDQWTGWRDFLGTRGIPKRKRMGYQETKNFIQNQGVQTRTKRMSYQEAVSFIQKQGIQTHTEFLKWSKSDQRPENFPSNPHIVYKDQWTSWGDFLGNKNLPIQMQYLEAKEYVQSLGINNPKDFIEWLRSNDRPENFPPQPHLFYSEWINSKDFLSAPEKTEYISYQEAKAFIAHLGITTARGFFEMMKFERDIFPKNFPPNPQTVYKNSGEWTGWKDFLYPIDKDQSTINEPIESPELEESFTSVMDLEESFIDEIDL